MSKVFSIGDIHGNKKALDQCLERSGFDFKKDKLICLGDTSDGWPFVKDCFNKLLEIKNLVYVLGNHDLWVLEWYDRKNYGSVFQVDPDPLWFHQGGKATIQSYDMLKMDDAHIELLRNAPFYHVEDNMVFVHGGFYENERIEDQPSDVLLWDRGLYHRVKMVHGCNPDYKIQDWDTVFIGHTSTSSKLGGYEPKFYCNLINLDQGAGWNGRLTIMDIHTKEYWQSDLAQELYPNIKGRT